MLDATFEARFWAKVDKNSPGGCWLWTGSASNGYGYIRRGGGTGNIRAHRAAYELLVGPVPDGMELDHLCGVKQCVNPAHLEPTTHQQNMKRSKLGAISRARQLAKTHCPYGHPYDEANTYITPKGDRHCRTCDRERQRARRQARAK